MNHFQESPHSPAPWSLQGGDDAKAASKTIQWLALGAIGLGIVGWLLVLREPKKASR